MTSAPEWTVGPLTSCPCGLRRSSKRIGCITSQIFDFLVPGTLHRCQEGVLRFFDMVDRRRNDYLPLPGNRPDIPIRQSSSTLIVYPLYPNFGYIG